MDRQTGMLRDFETFLSKSGTIPDDRKKFYVHWVRRFLKSCNFQLENINTERLSQYLNSLEADEKVAGWQVVSTVFRTQKLPEFGGLPGDVSG